MSTQASKKKYENISWLHDNDYKKAEGQLRLAFNDVFSVFKMYGHQEYVPGAIEEAVQLAVDFSLRLRGVDKPIRVSKQINARIMSYRNTKKY